MKYLRRERARAPAAPSGDTASRDDIEACFRLLLGRPPNPEERGHFANVGRDLPTVVAGYLNSREFRNRALLVPETGRILEADLDGIAVYYAPDDLAVGAHLATGAYEPDVLALLRRRLRPGMGVIDLGANIGAIALLAASIVGPTGYVLAVEPNARNARLLEASRRRNRFAHLTVAQCAAAPEPGLLVLNTSFSNGTTSPPRDDPHHLLDAETVQALAPQILVPANRRIDLIKADVEGAEPLALRGCLALIERDHPVIVSEFSPGQLRDISGLSGTAYLEWLESLGYQMSVINPDGSESAPLDPAGVMEHYRQRGTDHIDIVATP